MLKDLIFKLISIGASPGTAEPVILMYHSVGHNRAQFTITPEAFEMQMAFLKSSGRTCLKLSEFAERLRSGTLPKNAAAVTFDDGYADNHETAFPILKKHSIPATIFILTGSIGHDFTVNNRFEGQPGGPIDLRIMDEAQIKELSESDLVELMPHGHSHKILRDMSREDAMADIRGSKCIIEGIVGRPSTCFAYPYGKVSDETPAIVKELGFACAVVVKEGFVSHGSDSRQIDRYLLPRMNIGRSTSLAEFKCKIAKPRAYLKSKHAFHRSH